MTLFLIFILIIIKYFSFLHIILRNNLGNFVTVLEDYVKHNRRLRTPNQARFRQTCKQVIKSTRDPYKRLVANIMLYCLSIGDVINSDSFFIFSKPRGNSLFIYTHSQILCLLRFLAR